MMEDGRWRIEDGGRSKRRNFMKYFICSLMLLATGLTVRAQASMSSGPFGTGGLMKYTVAGVFSVDSITTNVSVVFGAGSTASANGGTETAVNQTYTFTSGNTFTGDTDPTITIQMSGNNDGDTCWSIINSGSGNLYNSTSANGPNAGNNLLNLLDPSSAANLDYYGNANGANGANPAPVVTTSIVLATNYTYVTNYSTVNLATNSVPVIPIVEGTGKSGVVADSTTRFYLHLTDNFDGTATAVWNQTPN